MDPNHVSQDDNQVVHLEDEIEARSEVADVPKKVFPFSPNRPWPASTPGERPSSGPQRDWSAALDLVNEAYEAIRMAEERASNAEDYSKQLAQYHGEQLRVADARLAAAEKRAEAAEARAREAEDWLVKFHDTIIDGFQKTKTRS